MVAAEVVYSVATRVYSWAMGEVARDGREGPSGSGAPEQGAGIAADVAAARREDASCRHCAGKPGLLIQELQHRVKHDLQVLSSLVYLQSCSVEDGSARRELEKLRRRIVTMALIHEASHDGPDPARVDFARYVRRLIGGIARSHEELSGRVRVEIEMETVALDVSTAGSCGLILGELVTNAFEHAFPGGRSGSIRIRLDSPAGDRYRLLVVDDGVGMAGGLHGPRALGLTVVRLLSTQLGGELAIGGDRGTAVDVSFPVDWRPRVLQGPD